MLIIENKIKTFFRLLWRKIKIVFYVIGIIVFIVLSSLVLVDFTPSENKNTIKKLETRIEVLEDIHNIKEQTE